MFIKKDLFVLYLSIFISSIFISCSYDAEIALLSRGSIYKSSGVIVQVVNDNKNEGEYKDASFGITLKALSIVCPLISSLKQQRHMKKVDALAVFYSENENNLQVVAHVPRSLESAHNNYYDYSFSLDSTNKK